MIVLDTNVVSEAMKPNCHLAVAAWFQSQLDETLFLTSTSLAELLLGIQLLSPGKRRDLLAEEIRSVLDLLFGARVLSFGSESARAYARIVSEARAKGRPIAIADGQIAAIAREHGFIVATRDTSPFEAAGVGFVNPWEA
jgi:toxin FitB